MTGRYIIDLFVSKLQVHNLIEIERSVPSARVISAIML